MAVRFPLLYSTGLLAAVPSPSISRQLLAKDKLQPFLLHAFNLHVPNFPNETLPHFEGQSPLSS